MEKKNKNKIKQYSWLIISIIVLFLTTYQNFKVNQINRINKVSAINSINQKNIPPKKLFLETWQLVKANYYESNLNKQNWKIG